MRIPSHCCHRVPQAALQRDALDDEERRPGEDIRTRCGPATYAIHGDVGLFSRSMAIDRARGWRCSGPALRSCRRCCGPIRNGSAPVHDRRPMSRRRLRSRCRLTISMNSSPPIRASVSLGPQNLWPARFGKVFQNGIARVVAERVLLMSQRSEGRCKTVPGPGFNFAAAGPAP